jgi:Transposase zinc-binding domain
MLRLRNKTLLSYRFKRYGFWRPIIGTVVRKFLKCGDLKQGFARVRCPKCREEFFVPFSCRVRCFCPSCHEKRALEKAGWVAEHVCAEVPHRQFVKGRVLFA